MRYNIFNQIHKALRALLYETALGLQQTHFANTEEAEPVLENLQLVMDIFDKHATHEDQYILPSLQQYEPGLTASFENEHVEDYELGQNLRKLISAYEHVSTTEARLELGITLHNAFIAFMTFNLDHMAKEESILNHRLWRYYSDDWIMQLNQRIVDSIPASDMSITSTWMMRGLNNAEIAAWLKAVQKNAPEFVFQQLFALAEKELPANRFRKLLEDLTEGAMVA